MKTILYILTVRKNTKEGKKGKINKETAYPT